MNIAQYPLIDEKAINDLSTPPNHLAQMAHYILQSLNQSTATHCDTFTDSTETYMLRLLQILMHPNCPQEIIFELAICPLPSIQPLAIQHKQCPVSVIQYLINHPERCTYKAALAIVKRTDCQASQSEFLAAYFGGDVAAAANQHPNYRTIKTFKQQNDVLSPPISNSSPKLSRPRPSLI